MTTHSLPVSTVVRVRSWSTRLSAAGLLVLAAATNAMALLITAALLAGVLLGAVVVGPTAWWRWRTVRAMWSINDLPPLPDLDRPLAEVLPPTRSRAEVFATAPPQETPMPTTYPEIALPPEYAATLDTHAIDAVPDPPTTRWLRLRDMHRGDEFTFADKTLTLVGLESPDHLSAVGLVSVAVRGLPVGGDGVALLTLPAGQRWQMVQALRRASVRCLVCGEHDGLGEQTYDLAKPDTRDVEAICRTCQQVTTGGAS